jgi:hypothetical protein
MLACLAIDFGNLSVRKVTSPDLNKGVRISALSHEGFHNVDNAEAFAVSVLVTIAWAKLTNFHPFPFSEPSVLCQAFRAEDIRVGFRSVLENLPIAFNLPLEQSSRERYRLRSGFQASAAMQLEQICQDAAHVAIRIVHLTNDTFQFSECVFGQFDDALRVTVVLSAIK